MRHRVRGRKLNRTSSHRQALRRNLAQSVIEHGRIETTLAKAKEVRPMIEKLVTLAKKGDLHSRRRAHLILRDREIHEEAEKGSGDYEYAGRVLRKLFEEIGPRFEDRTGGYTRIVRTWKHRIGDAAPKVCLMFLESDEEESAELAKTGSRRRRRAAGRLRAAGMSQEQGSGGTDEERETPSSQVDDAVEDSEDDRDAENQEDAPVEDEQSTDATSDAQDQSSSS
jgi:large subunit ribosomal protein L17